jgi:hypothetical protein
MPALSLGPWGSEFPGAMERIMSVARQKVQTGAIGAGFQARDAARSR